jgi:hypothetical protein
MSVAAIAILGPTYLSRSVQFSSQATKNLYSEIEPTGRNQGALMPWPGTVAFGSSGGLDRGQHVFQSVLYKVNGTNLYSIDATGAFTLIGVIGGSERCIFADDGDKMVIVSDGLVKMYDGTTLSTISDALLVNTQSVAILNKQATYDTGVGGEFIVAAFGDPTSLNQSNTATAESDGDSLVRCYSFGQRMYFMGKKTVEPWYNSGEGNPPYARIDTGIIQVGLGALHSVANTDVFMYFLSDDLNIYQMQANQARVVSNAAIASEIQSFDVTDDAIGYATTFDNQSFYVLTFPTEGKTYCFAESMNDTTLLTSFDGRYIGNSYSYVYGKHLLADRRTGNLVQWDFDTYTDTGLPIIRERTTSVVSSESLGKPRSRLLIRWLELLCQTGLGLPTGQGSNPKVMIEASFDGGHSYEKQSFIEIGQAGEFTGRVRADMMGSFYDAVFKVTFSDPIFFSIQGASVDVDGFGF